MERFGADITVLHML